MWHHRWFFSFLTHCLFCQTLHQFSSIHLLTNFSVVLKVACVAGLFLFLLEVPETQYWLSQIRQQPTLRKIGSCILTLPGGLPQHRQLFGDQDLSCCQVGAQDNMHLIEACLNFQELLKLDQRRNVRRCRIQRQMRLSMLEFRPQAKWRCSEMIMIKKFKMIIR